MQETACKFLSSYETKGFWSKCYYTNQILITLIEQWGLIQVLHKLQAMLMQAMSKMVAASSQTSLTNPPPLFRFGWLQAEVGRTQQHDYMGDSISQSVSKWVKIT